MCDQLSNALASAMLLCNTQLQELGAAAEQQGTTALVCMVERKTLILANSGDSRAVLCCDGAAVQLTEDHKVRELTTAHHEASTRIPKYSKIWWPV
jgi:serine/threonine protein phosphatase PrpC